MILATLMALTPLDYHHLARTIQVEAALGTMDEYCVAVSILNRVNSKSFPNSVSDVVYQPGQYEGLTFYRPVANQRLVNEMQSDVGKAKFQTAYSIIGDRTSFKGQSMLPYRVVAEDPMCDPKGNFFHYHWQS